MAKNKYILIGSVLKPVDEPRMFERIALSIQANLPDVNIHIVGKKGKDSTSEPHITFHPIFNHKRLSIKRIFSGFRFFKIGLKLKPKVIIICTHELLWPSLWLRWLFRCQLIYDIQENYVSNMVHMDNWPKFLKPLLVSYLKFKETVSSYWVSRFWLAEKSYASQLPFIKKRFTVFENKYQPKQHNQEQYNLHKRIPFDITLVYSGSISKEYGIFQAIEITENLRKINPAIQLRIIGYCAHQPTLNQLLKELSTKDYIELIGGSSPVSHDLIIQSYINCTAVLLPYLPNKAIDTCIPTKIYECICYKTPMIIRDNPLWKTVAVENEHAIYYPSQHINYVDFYQRIMQTTFYSEGVPKHIFWNKEKETIAKEITTLIKCSTN